jgi:hypothetical protein
LKNIGRDLEAKETLVDVAYKSIEEWKKKKNDFETLKFAIKYETLKKRSKAKGKMPKNIGNQRDVDKFQDIRSERGSILLVDEHGKTLGFRCSIPLELVEHLETTAAILVMQTSRLETSPRGHSSWPVSFTGSAHELESGSGGESQSSSRSGKIMF